MATTKILIAGFGGQGILFAGKALAYSGLKVGKEVAPALRVAAEVKVHLGPGRNVQVEVLVLLHKAPQARLVIG